jgi:putative addiction module killer protein
MSIEIVLNELSFSSPASSIPVAQQRMIALISTIRSATKKGASRVLRTHSDFNNAMLAPDYPVARWRNDPTVDREIQRFLKTLETKAPFLDPITDALIQDQKNLSEFLYEDQPAVGLGIAILLGALAVSVQSDPCWLQVRLPLQWKFIDEDSEVWAEISQNIEVIHASSSDHIAEHQDWITDRIRLQPWHPGDSLLQGYRTEAGEVPFSDWLQALDNPRAKSMVESRLQRIKLGNLGDCKPLDDGVSEFRIYGCGYRVYFGNISAEKLLLLWGGDKSTQTQDIKQAITYWKDYKRRNDSSR